MSLSTDDARLGTDTSAFKAGRTAPKVDYASITPVFIVIDVTVILLLSILTSLAFSEARSDGFIFDITRPLGIGIATAMAFVLITQTRGLYKPWRFMAVNEQVSAALVNWTIAVLFLGTVIFCLKVGDDTSRIAMGTFAAIGFLVLPALRWAFASWLHRGIASETVAGRAAILVGEERELARIAAKDLMAGLGVTEQRRFILPPQGAPDGLFTDSLKSALQFARQQKTDEIILVMPWNDSQRLEDVRNRLRALPLPVKLLPDVMVRQVLDGPRVEFGCSLAIELQRAPLSRFELAQKRTLDIAVSAMALTVLLPLLAAVAVAIKLDSKGPVIFRQRRNGFGGREFTIFKFRSMTVMEDGEKVVQAQRNDARVTRVGRVLRSTSLDELPQVLNVLLGHMSIVGPRPHALAHDDVYSKLISGYAFRHHVKPGITGWAQVKGLRGETAQIELMERRIEMDLWYINNWSLWLDIRIILRTFVEVLKTQAY